MVTAYVRKLIAEWQASGKKLIELHEASGRRIPKSAPSQIMSGKLGVGGAAQQGFARAFGLTVPQLVNDAHLWDKGNHVPGNDALTGDARAEAEHLRNRARDLEEALSLALEENRRLRRQLQPRPDAGPQQYDAEAVEAVGTKLDRRYGNLSSHETASEPSRFRAEEGTKVEQRKTPRDRATGTGGARKRHTPRNAR